MDGGMPLAFLLIQESFHDGGKRRGVMLGHGFQVRNVEGDSIGKALAVRQKCLVSGGGFREQGFIRGKGAVAGGDRGNAGGLIGLEGAFLREKLPTFQAETGNFRARLSRMS